MGVGATSALATPIAPPRQSLGGCAHQHPADPEAREPREGPRVWKALLRFRHPRPLFWNLVHCTRQIGCNRDRHVLANIQLLTFSVVGCLRLVCSDPWCIALTIAAFTAQLSAPTHHIHQSVLNTHSADSKSRVRVSARMSVLWACSHDVEEVGSKTL